MGRGLSLGVVNWSVGLFHELPRLSLIYSDKVNTRCIYHRLVNARSSPDNLTLCPILDFANHTYTQKFAYPGAYQAEIFNVGPSSKRKFGEDFVLLAPSTEAVVAGEQLFLQYGMHANRTLFTEYGFVNFFDWDNVPESFQAEVEVDSYIEALFERRGELGSFMKNVLVDEGYWRLLFLNVFWVLQY